MGDEVPSLLLSGGLDSAIIASVACNILKKRGITKVNTFCVGFTEESADIKYSRIMADYLKE